VKKNPPRYDDYDRQAVPEERLLAVMDAMNSMTKTAMYQPSSPTWIREHKYEPSSPVFLKSKK
jgi:hypothetical protein